MITRSNLAEQLREYQIRSKHDWASVSFFSSTSNLTSSRAYNACFYLAIDSAVMVVYHVYLQSFSLDIMKHLQEYNAFQSVGTRTNSNHCAFLFCGYRVDVVVFVIWELVILAFLVFSAVSLYFRHMQLAFILVCITMLLLLCMKITKQVRLARKKKRRMLLPLSM
ncbi:hypothetical protein Gogos_008274 [Gossypium gossypioides]|uniref:Uncharacterized protein n=2 Tax=Gossypium TaxID=3633 RepID=A0A7J9CB75_GOSGO|nr:hypothetical protein [Gossypium gossypioides]